ncbi:hypothetical protein HYV79_02120 [Candidatus Woesearchaeota archaeon]|nr:hypothetical protein [Candidatus Woesearchaeota archaeon]
MNLTKIITKEEFNPLLYSAIVLFIVSILGILLTQTSSKTIFYLIFAIFFYLITPGYFILLNFKNLDSLERIVLGMVISSAIIPLILYSINIFGIKISRINVFITILLVIIIALIIKNYRCKNKC